jgi:hypothetical protein
MSKSSHKKKIESITNEIKKRCDLETDPLLNDVLNWVFLIKPTNSLTVITQIIIHWDLKESKLSEQDESTIDYLETFLKP